MTRKGVVLILCLFISSLADGQSLQWRLSTGNQQMVEESIAPAFSIIRQEFQLQDEASGQNYNLDSLAYFGYSEAICIRTVDGFITSRSVLSPWENDENIKDYPEYKPTRSMLSEYDGKTDMWKAVGALTYEEYSEITYSEKIHVCDSLFGEKGLEIDTDEGEKDAWLVWIYREGNKLSFKSFRQRYNLNNASGSVPVLQPEEDPNLLFGVMLTTDFPQIGVIRFKLAAIVERFADGWEAVGIMAPSNPAAEEHTLIPAPEVPIEKITPPADKKNPWRKKK